MNGRKEKEGGRFVGLLVKPTVHVEVQPSPAHRTHQSKTISPFAWFLPSPRRTAASAAPTPSRSFSSAGTHRRTPRSGANLCPSLYRIWTRLLLLLLPLSVRKPLSFGATFCGEEPNRIQSNPGDLFSSRPAALTSHP